MSNNEIVFTKDENKIVITIPIPLLKWACENNPADPIIVKDEQQFAMAVMEELQNGLGSAESGLTGFQKLLDEAMLEVAIGGHDFVDLKSDEF